ncbi:hypothetical protein N803_11790 [Knoellia subterranea KCTC 19937]|uniref:N-acetyltransferase domain-containing protein n=1 Tax=Knoellia subterranea KCTC 19937 TaxID=1385521 RepID=A0A0A0JNV3_9MICO|nr:hypothetical protein N803_11790 [Knoellia subterranea KCTC 19937]
MRPASEGDVDDIARIWRAGWHEVHLEHVPQALVDARPDSSWRPRVVRSLGDTLVTVGADGRATGFVMTHEDEVEHLYVGDEARGSGAAAALLSAAEGRIAASGHDRAWLAVVDGNPRARRFYERSGWHDEGGFTHYAPGVQPEDEPIALPCRRYVRDLSRTRG